MNKATEDYNHNNDVLETFVMDNTTRNNLIIL